MKLHQSLTLLGAAALTPLLCLQAIGDPPRDSNPKKPRGVRLTLTVYYVVTDSSDGVRDRDVEPYGYLTINGRRLWSIQKKNHMENVRPYQRILRTGSTYRHEVLFDKPAWAIVINGYLKDYDAGSDDDGMWNPSNAPRVANLKSLSEQPITNLSRPTMTLPGDRKSENADLIIELNEVAPIY